MTFRKDFNKGEIWSAQQMHAQSPQFSSQNLWRNGHKINIAILVVSTLYVLFTGYTGVVLALNILSFSFFLYRSVLSVYGLKGDKDCNNMLDVNDPNLPTYCILLPMRNEPVSVVADLVKNIDNLNYPKDKLDVIMLVDQDDDYLADIDAMEKPSHFRIVSASAKFPFTKPKVCNLGLYDTDAEYVTIYDAEDKPEPNQLLKVLYKFGTDDNISCVQCRLHYNNKKPNWMASLFENEYLTWFSLTIHGLSKSQNENGIIPLGGTSQHLKTQELMELGGWDAFNVTEDCELGVRLVRKGKRIVTSNSHTDEIAVDDVKRWIPQRTRWQLGFMITFFSHTRDYKSLIKDLGWNRFMHFMYSVFGNFLSPLITPLLFIIFLVSLVSNGSGETYLNWLPMVTLIGNYILIVSMHALASIKHNNCKHLGYCFVQPVYYLLQAITVYRAVYKLITAPYTWEKTAHKVED